MFATAPIATTVAAVFYTVATVAAAATAVP